MFKSKAFQAQVLSRKTARESGNAVVIVLVVLAVIAVGVLAYMSTKSGDDAPSAPGAAAAADPQNPGQTAAGDENMVIKPGNPIVAKVNGTDVTRVDVFNFIQTLPPQTRQMPVSQLFPIAVEQVVNARVITEKTKGINLDSDPEVKKQMEIAKENITRGVYIQKQVSDRITEDRLKAAYEQYKSTFPKIDELKASHILVKEEDKAKDLIKQLDEGGNFAELAKANSIDGTAANGGELGYFAEADVVPEFAKAAYGTDVGSYTKKPVKTEFGYHIIKVEEKRVRPPAEYEAAKPFLDAQIRRVVLDEVIQQWKDAARIERFDINGDPVEPAAGNEAPAAAPAPAEAPAAAPSEAPVAQ